MNHHQKLHFALCAVHILTATILFAEAAYAHAGCAALAAAIYGLLAWLGLHRGAAE
jgi:uncharacterized membrane protein YkvI